MRTVETAMMRKISKYWRASSAAWMVVAVALTVAYTTLFAGILGLVSAGMVSLVTLSAALIGCVAAAVYMVSALGDVRYEAHTR